MYVLLSLWIFNNYQTFIIIRRRAISRTHYEDYKNKIATKSVNNTTPFVDKSRVAIATSLSRWYTAM